MTTLTFFGAAGSVTGSRFLLEIAGKRTLVDCGLFQGSKSNRVRNWEPFPVDPATIERVLLTHAHIDHSGYLPRLVSEGFKGDIHCTHATRELCEIMLKDSAHLQEEDARWANKKGFSKHKKALPLYTTADAEQSLRLFKPLHYGEELLLAESIRLKFRNAGHILGSAFIDLKRPAGQPQRKILFSGDFGRPGRPVLPEPDQVYNIDYLILESTYGDRLHAEVDPLDELAKTINDSFDRGGVLLIPAFSVGRTQTLLYAIRELEEQQRIAVAPVFMDSPMAISATQVFNQRITDCNLTARKEHQRGKNIFQPERLQICTTREQSKAINRVRGKAIIISASGMATGGRILHHLAARLGEARNTVLLIGYQAAGTRGRSLLEGHPQVKIHGAEVPVKAAVANISGFSAHGDYEEILAWLMAFNKPPRKTFIVHGEQEASQALAQRIEQQYNWEVEIPAFGSSYELDF